MAWPRLLIASLGIAATTFGGSHDEINLVLNSQPMEGKARIIEGRVYLPATYLAKVLNGSASLDPKRKTLTVVIPTPRHVPDLKSMDSDWTSQSVFEWGQRASDWCDRSYALLSLIDQDQMGTNDPGMATACKFSLNSKMRSLKALKSRIQDLAIHPIRVIGVAEELGKSGLGEIGDWRFTTAMNGAPSVELCNKLLNQEAEGNKLLTEIMPHVAAIESWYDKAAGIPTGW